MSDGIGFTNSEFIEKYYDSKNGELEKLVKEYSGQSFETSVDNRKFYNLISSIAREIVKEVFKTGDNIYDRIEYLEKLVSNEGSITLNSNILEGNLGLGKCPKILIENELNEVNGEILTVKIDSKSIPFLFKQNEDIIIRNEVKLSILNPTDENDIILLDDYLDNLISNINENKNNINSTIEMINILEEKINTNLLENYYNKTENENKIIEMILDHLNNNHVTEEQLIDINNIKNIENSLNEHIGIDVINKNHLNTKELSVIRELIANSESGDVYVTYDEFRTFQTILNNVKNEFTDLFDEEGKFKFIYLPILSSGAIDLSSIENRISLLEDHKANTIIHTNELERQNFNNKYNKPLNGIPYEDLDSNLKSLLSRINTDGGDDNETPSTKIVSATEADINKLFTN